MNGNSLIFKWRRRRADVIPMLRRKRWNGLLAKSLHAKAVAGLAIEIGLLSDTGRVRITNEDSLGYVRFDGNRALLAFIADGMGGCQAGDVASQTAAAVFEEVFLQCWQENPQHIPYALAKGFNAANAAIYQLAQEVRQRQGMGTTLVALVVIAGFIHYAHIGDSRLYLFRSGKYLQLTEDDSVVAELLKNGLITPEQAKCHSDRHVLTRAVGTQPELDVQGQLFVGNVKSGDSLLLCSDGLYGLVDADEMQSIIACHPAQQACQTLVDLANDRGGDDNISVIIVKIANTEMV